AAAGSSNPLRISPRTLRPLVTAGTTQTAAAKTHNANNQPAARTAPTDSSVIAATPQAVVSSHRDRRPAGLDRSSVAVVRAASTAEGVAGSRVAGSRVAGSRVARVCHSVPAIAAKTATPPRAQPRPGRLS